MPFLMDFEGVHISFLLSIMLKIDRLSLNYIIYYIFLPIMRYSLSRFAAMTSIFKQKTAIFTPHLPNHP